MGTMNHCLIHGEPLHARMLRGNYNIYIVFTLDAVVKAGKQTVCIRRQIHPNHIGLLVCHMIQEPRVLMGKTVVVLLPYI